MSDFYGYKPYSYQRAVHNLLVMSNSRGKRVVVKSSRQKGKSLMIENELLRWAINKPRSKNRSVSPTIKQAKKMYKEIFDAVVHTGIVKSSNATDLEIKLINGSTISFHSAEQGEALRGYTVSGILCIDEACFIPEEIFYLVLPWCDVWRAPILIVSTPKLKAGWFYEYFMRGLNKEKDYFSVDWCSPEFKPDIEKVLPPERLEEYRKILPKTIFETEYLGNFVDNGSGVFGKITYGAWTEPYSELYFGIDWGTGEDGDYTAISGVNERGEQVILEYWNNEPDPLKQIAKIAEIIGRNKSKVKKVLAEKNSIGDTYYKLLQQALPDIQIQPFDTTNTSKRAIVEGLAAAIGEGNAKMKADTQAEVQFNAYTCEVTKGGQITYNASFGFNDDIVIATALSHQAKRTSFGEYRLLWR